MKSIPMGGLKPLPTEQPVQLELGGKLRTLKMNFNTLALIETMTGKSAIGGDLFTNISFREILIILYASMRHEDPSLTIESVGDMCQIEDTQAISEAIVELIKRAFPTPKKGEGSGEKSDPLVGKNSGQLVALT